MRVSEHTTGDPRAPVPPPALVALPVTEYRRRSAVTPVTAHSA